MPKSKVALVKCNSYDYDQVKFAVEKGLALIGGPEQFVKPGEKILLKPNLLSADPPEKCVTTHPSVFKAVAQVFKSSGGEITYGDSPAFQKTKTAALKAGIAAVADEVGVSPADFATGEEVVFSGGLQNKKFTIAKGVLAAEGIISLPKLKTHGLTKMTGCIKNQFGCIPGALKGEFHVKIPDSHHFSKMLVDLNMLVKPRLYIMDGIMAMEGNGPRGGKPRKMNILLFSTDPVALDATVCRIVQVDPAYVPTTRYGQEAGMGTYLAGEIEIVGESLESFTCPDFNVKRGPIHPYQSKKIMGAVRNYLVPRPYIIESKCIKCGVCVQMCPVDPKAVNLHENEKDKKNKPPAYKYERCIRCYCCQELCPESAIEFKVPTLRHLFTKKIN
jgi:uncharacterized protein (DUF362 family)/NAD-dependent dihydropyrimidine dehydrogenase PreA subunit